MGSVLCCVCTRACAQGVCGCVAGGFVGGRGEQPVTVPLDVTLSHFCSAGISAAWLFPLE